MLFVILGSIITACSGGGDSDGDSSVETGSIALSLRIDESGFQRLQREALTNADFDCEANGIVTIEVIVYDEFDIIIASGGPWECEAGEGFIPDVEAGVDRVVEVLAKDELGVTIFRGEATDVVVSAGETTEVGPVFLVPIVNRPPVLDPIGNIKSEEKIPVEFTVTASDPDGDLLTFQATNFPANAAFDPETQVFSWLPDFGESGNYSVIFTVIDDGIPPRSDTEEVIITIGDVNRPPAFDPVGEKQVNEGELLEFVVSATDLDDDLLTYEATDIPEGADFNSETQTFSWQPGFEDAGNYKAIFTVTDDGDPPLSDSVEVIITVGPINRPPKFDPVGSVPGGTEGQPIQFQVTAQDPDGDNLTYSAEDLPPNADFDPQTQTFFWIPGFQDFGSFTVTFIVTDDGGPPLSDELQVVIFVGNQNLAPLLNPIGDKTLNLADFIESTPFLEFTVSGSDPDGDGISFSAENLPTGFGSDAVFDSATLTFLWPMITLSDIGSYQVRFIVTDDGDPPLSDFETISIIIANNDPPFFTSVDGMTAGGGIPIEVLRFEGSPLSFDVQATDFNQDQLTFSATGLPSGASVDPVTGTFSWNSPSVGNYNIVFTVTDNGAPSLSDTQSVTLTVELG